MKERFGAKQPGIDAAALPLPDRGGVADQAAIPDQHRAHRRCRRWPPCSAAASALHTNGMDEAFAIPTEEAMRIALRTQQIIAEETNVTSVVDPLGGSLLRREPDHRVREAASSRSSTRSTRRGGTIKLIEEGWFQQQIADFAYDTALRRQSGDEAGDRRQQISSMPDEQLDIEIASLRSDDGRAPDRAHSNRVRRERDNAKVNALLDRLVETAKDERRTSCR